MTDRVEALRQQLDELGDRPLPEHVPVLSEVLGAVVEELDDLARSIPARPPAGRR